MILYVIEEMVLFVQDGTKSWHLNSYDPYRKIEEAKKFMEEKLRWQGTKGTTRTFLNSRILEEFDEDGNMLRYWRLVEKETSSYKR